MDYAPPGRDVPPGRPVRLRRRAVARRPALADRRRDTGVPGCRHRRLRTRDRGVDPPARALARVPRDRAPRRVRRRLAHARPRLGGARSGSDRASVDEQRRGGHSCRTPVRHLPRTRGLVLLAAVLVHLDQTGTLVFDGGLHAGLATTLGLLGIGLNVGFIGLHPWIVDSYPRPHVAASVVLAACTTKVGVYALARAVPDGSVVVASLGGAMLVVGVTYAILQTDLRRLLSYHIVSQVGIMVAGIGVGTSLGVAGAIAHLVNNVLYKSLLFMVAGVIIVRTGESNLKHLGGLARPMPGTFGAFLVAALGITGVPGFNGFVSKGMVFDAAEAAGFDLLWWLLVVGSVGTVVSFAKFGYYAFVRQGPERDVADAGRSESIGLVALAIPCLAFGLAPGLQFAVLPGSTAAAKPFAPSQFAKAAAILGAGSVAFVLLKRSLSRVSGVPDLDAVYHPSVGGSCGRVPEPSADSAAGSTPSSTTSRPTSSDFRRPTGQAGWGGTDWPTTWAQASCSSSSVSSPSSSC
ncbi:proton-conducting transporter membrane subunit [Haloarculaceae archaeon H-GB2-1]|nr:proton-conducting transporter membrane subunit [Haloarculaceae archaeon H-GB11]MEA5407776.1 proton-conducting transporter membrane subunit [Haloarculaceae archaeon H-GB2-1]